jgi:hypothetical protein
MIKKVLRVLASLGVCLLLVSPTLVQVPCAGAADQPTSVQVLSVFAYQHLLEPNDQGYLAHCEIDYPTTPSELSTDTYIVSLIDTDNTTVLQTVAPYAFVDNGYGQFLVWMYFSASSAPTWNQAYTVRLEGNPTLTWTPTTTPPTTSAGVSYWSTSTSISSTNGELAARLLYIGAQLGKLAEWSLTMTEQVVGGGTVFTATGESYIVNVIPNVHLMAPTAFSSGTISPLWESMSSNTTYADNVTDVLGTPLDMTDLAAATGTTRSMISTIGWIVGMGLLLFYVVRIVGGKIALPIASTLIIIGAALRMIPLGLAVGMGVICIILTGFMLFYKPSNA